MSKTKEKVLTPKDFAANFLKSNKKQHLNFEEDRGMEVTSTGSVNLDAHMDGGVTSGCIMLCGANGSGKTSLGLTIMKNRLDAFKDGMGLYVKAEGRLSENMKKRSGIKFVSDPEEWTVGTCLVLESNVYEFVFDFIRGLINNNPENNRYCILIDSMHGLIRADDVDKGTSEASKVAAGALLSSDFLKRTSLAMGKRGHLCMLVAQVRSSIKISQYEASDPNNQTNSSGGNAQLHFSNWILEVRKPNRADYICKKDGQMTVDNPAIGHNAKVLLQKADNENRGLLISYPIKHNRVDGKSVWKEREIIDLLLSWEYIEKSGAWFEFDSELSELLEKAGVESKKVQGINSLYDLLEENSEATNLLEDFVKENIIKSCIL